MTKPEQDWDWAMQEAEQIEDEYTTRDGLRELIAAALRKSAANERALIEADIAATRLMGASQPDSSYQEGFADACDNIERRIRQRGEAGDAGSCTDCGGPVYHRVGKPGEFDHECKAEAGERPEEEK